jgi:hypothetical protein
MRHRRKVTGNHKADWWKRHRQEQGNAELCYPDLEYGRRHSHLVSMMSPANGIGGISACLTSQRAYFRLLRADDKSDTASELLLAT